MPLAIEMTEYGPPHVLRPVERTPVDPGDDEVIVRVAVAGINRADLFIRSGEWTQAGGWPYVPGLEACGTVERVGARVHDLRPGDRVITMMQRLGGVHGARPGGYQETVCVPASTLARVPDGVELRHAGALGLPAVTAQIAMRVLDVRPGMRALVHAGSSAVGLMAIQIARRAGAHVIATGTRPDKFALMQEAGAHECVATRDAAWSDAMAPIDRAFDLVGRATFGATVSRLAPHGRLVFVGGTTGGDVAFSAWDLMNPVTLTGYSSETLTRDELQRAIDDVVSLRVVSLTRFPLADAASAHAALESGALAGRVVLEPSS